MPTGEYKARQISAMLVKASLITSSDVSTHLWKKDNMQPNIKSIAIAFPRTTRITTVIDRLLVGRGLAGSALKRNLAALSVVSLLLFPALASLRAQTIEQYAVTDT